jgi:uncharacterized membrane protein
MTPTDTPPTADAARDGVPAGPSAWPVLAAAALTAGMLAAAPIEVVSRSLVAAVLVLVLPPVLVRLLPATGRLTGPARTMAATGVRFCLFIAAAVTLLRTTPPEQRDSAALTFTAFFLAGLLREALSAYRLVPVRAKSEGLSAKS